MKKNVMRLAEVQAYGLINLAMEGINPDELIKNAVREIREGMGGGPYHVGSKVRINTAWAGKTVEGTDVTMTRGDVVSIVMPNLGEHGQDKMVLMADGKTRVVVPYAILGEALVREQNGLDKGPDGHEVPPAKGKLGGTIAGKAVGDAETPEKLQPPKPITAKQPVTLPAVFQGAGKPKDDPSAQVLGAGVTTISGKTVEQVAGRVLRALNKIMKESKDDLQTYHQANELRRLLIREKDAVMYAMLHEAIFGKDHFTVENLTEVASMMKKMKEENGEDDDDEDKKKEKDVEEQEDDEEDDEDDEDEVKEQEDDDDDDDDDDEVKEQDNGDDEDDEDEVEEQDDEEDDEEDDEKKKVTEQEDDEEDDEDEVDEQEDDEEDDEDEVKEQEDDEDDEDEVKEQEDDDDDDEVKEQEDDEEDEEKKKKEESYTVRNIDEVFQAMRRMKGR